MKRMMMTMRMITAKERRQIYMVIAAVSASVTAAVAAADGNGNGKRL